MNESDDPTPDGAVALWQELRLKPELDAGMVLSFLHLRVPPVNVLLVAERLGVVVQEVEPIGWAGAVDSRKLPARIFVKHDDALTRKRFTIAHELGHLLLHPPGKAYRDKDFAGHTQFEVQANRFAAELLMPKWMLTVAMQSTGGNVSRLANLFQVSADAMSIRLVNAGIIHSYGR